MTWLLDIRRLPRFPESRLALGSRPRLQALLNGLAAFGRLLGGVGEAAVTGSCVSLGPLPRVPPQA